MAHARDAVRQVRPEVRLARMGMPVDETRDDPLAVDRDNRRAAGDFDRISPAYGDDVPLRFEYDGTVDDRARAIEHVRANVRGRALTRPRARTDERCERGDHASRGLHGYGDVTSSYAHVSASRGFAVPKR